MVDELTRPFTKSFSKVAIVLAVAFPSSETQREVPAQWVIWNIGQGSWITRIENRHCFHFDAGGEGRFPAQVVRACRGFRNVIAISHSDWDHVSFIGQLHTEFPNLCRQGPFDRRPSKTLMRIPECKTIDWWSWHPTEKTKRSNDGSLVFYFRKLLYPGDSPKKFEKFWMDQIPGPVSFLVLAHHGSKSGTSPKLLANLHLKLAIASARKQKYGHPHERVKVDLKKANVPLLSTESWGSLHLMD
jgi:competence protein ComEC